MAARTSTSQGINLWDVMINPTNLKCSSLPLFSLRNQYSINFHLFVVYPWFLYSIPDFTLQRLDGVFRGFVSS